LGKHTRSVLFENERCATAWATVSRVSRVYAGAAAILAKRPDDGKGAGQGHRAPKSIVCSDVAVSECLCVYPIRSLIRVHLNDTSEAVCKVVANEEALVVASDHLPKLTRRGDDRIWLQKRSLVEKIRGCPRNNQNYENGRRAQSCLVPAAVRGANAIHHKFRFFLSQSNEADRLHKRRRKEEKQKTKRHERNRVKGRQKE
jgi:hypothetical protein